LSIWTKILLIYHHFHVVQGNTPQKSSLFCIWQGAALSAVLSLVVMVQGEDSEIKGNFILLNSNLHHPSSPGIILLVEYSICSIWIFVWDSYSMWPWLAGFQLRILLPQLPEHWDYRYAPPCSTQFGFLQRMLIYMMGYNGHSPSYQSKFF
jgi:hypothetical protein